MTYPHIMVPHMARWNFSVMAALQGTFIKEPGLWHERCTAFMSVGWYSKIALVDTELPNMIVTHLWMGCHVILTNPSSCWCLCWSCWWWWSSMMIMMIMIMMMMWLSLSLSLWLSSLLLLWWLLLLWLWLLLLLSSSSSLLLLMLLLLVLLLLLLLLFARSWWSWWLGPCLSQENWATAGSFQPLHAYRPEKRRNPKKNRWKNCTLTWIGCGSERPTWTPIFVILGRSKM